MKFYEMFLSPNEIWGGVQWQKLTEKRLQDDVCLEAYGYKVYSQNDEDGIIQEIFNRIGVTNKIFVEFGVQNGLESIGHYLLFQGWKGFWIEGSETYVEEIHYRFHPVLASRQLKCKHAFITRDNINMLLREASLPMEIDLLSIDIDGNDYYIWSEIDVVRPRVVIIEYNGKFPPDCDWKMAYNENHIWDGSDWHGASLKALELLGRKLGYQLVGTNISGVNAFFVRKDLAVGLFYEPATAEELYNPIRPALRHLSGHPARYCLKDQREGLGILNYCPDEGAITSYGFHDMETMETKKYCWSNNLQSELLVRLEPGATAVSIPYMLAAAALEQCDGCYPVKIAVVHGMEKEYPVTTENGIWQVSLPIPNKEYAQIKITVPFLWRPSSLLGTQDSRELGIAVILSDIHSLIE